MPGLIFAAVNPDNTPHGYNWTFAFPMLLFIIIGGVLYLLFSRPHRRVPARSIALPGRSAAAAPPPGAAATAGSTPAAADPAGDAAAAADSTEETE